MPESEALSHMVDYFQLSDLKLFRYGFHYAQGGHPRHIGWHWFCDRHAARLFSSILCTDPADCCRMFAMDFFSSIKCFFSHRSTNSLLPLVPHQGI